MQFDELKTEIKPISFVVVRADTQDYLEVVILKNNLDGLCAILDRLFGSPIWPPENKIPALAVEAIKKYGGVMSGQTLYFWNQDDFCVFAMLWPWSDGEHITLKCGQE
jgi:hypothetical protein